MLPEPLRGILIDKADEAGWECKLHDSRMKEYTIKAVNGKERYMIRLTVFSETTPGEIQSESN